MMVDVNEIGNHNFKIIPRMAIYFFFILYFTWYLLGVSVELERVERVMTIYWSCMDEPSDFVSARGQVRVSVRVTGSAAVVLLLAAWV